MDPIKKTASPFLEQKMVVPQKGKTIQSAKALQKKNYDYQKKMDQIHSVIQEHLRVDNFKLNFRVDQETGRVVVKILDADTGEVIREVPAPESLAIAKEIEELKGILLNNNI